MRRFLLLIKKTTNSFNFSFTFVFLYVSLINFFILKTTPELIFLQFIILIFFFRRFRLKNFAKKWMLFISAFVIYEFLRGYADDLSPFYGLTLYLVYYSESWVFGTLPTIWLQQQILPESWTTQIALFFYSIFFYYSFLVAFLIWLKDPAMFGIYSKKFILLTYISLAIFFLVPTAPPWLVAKEFDLPLERYLTERTILNEFKYVNVYRHFVYDNAVAALPSLHVAWPIFSTTFLVANYKNRWFYFLFIIPIMITVSIVLTGEHYVIDVIASVLLVILILKSNKLAIYLSQAYFNLQKTLFS